MQVWEITELGGQVIMSIRALVAVLLVGFALTIFGWFIAPVGAKLLFVAKEASPFLSLVGSVFFWGLVPARILGPLLLLFAAFWLTFVGPRRESPFNSE
jgi:hypothetical protein